MQEEEGKILANLLDWETKCNKTRKTGMEANSQPFLGRQTLD